MSYVLVAYFATWILVPKILFSGKRPESTLAWIWAVLLFPFIGPIAFLLFGVDRVTRARIRKRSHQARERAVPEDCPIPEGHEPLFHALEKLSDIPTATAREIQLLTNAEEFYPALERRIREARHHVHIEFFIWENDKHGARLRDALIDAVKRGVEVRLLLDRMGCKNTDREFFTPLRAAGGEFAWFRALNPLRKRFSLHLRNHRKLQIIDGRIAFIGGMNVGKEYMGENRDLGFWRDQQIEVQGNVVSALQQVFVEDWHFAAEKLIEGEEYFPERGDCGPIAAQVVLGGPDLPHEPMAESTLAVLYHAKKRAWIATGYFAPDARLLSALRIAALRGVDVRILNTEKSDHPYLVGIAHSYYEDLMAAGVRILEYAKGINHAKSMLIDDELLMIGSANFDDRSMRLNFELNILLRSGAGAKALEHAFEEDFAESHELEFRKFKQRPFKRRVMEALVRPLAPMT